MEEKELVYELMTGQFDLTLYGPSEAKLVKNAFAPGSALGQMQDTIYRSRMRLANRLGSGLEDRDLTNLVNSYEDIQRQLSYLMYEYALMIQKGKDT